MNKRDIHTNTSIYISPVSNACLCGFSTEPSTVSVRCRLYCYYEITSVLKLYDVINFIYVNSLIITEMFTITSFIYAII